MSNAAGVAPRQPSDESRRPWIIPQAWIIGPGEDILLFLGTPLLLLAVFALAEHFWTMAALGMFSTVLAMGHYLPGLMRAYGDRALFRRFRWRFLLAPVVLMTAAVVMMQRDSQAFLLVVVLWGAWHWLMQTYGLVRIYDAKLKNFDAVSARLDYALCISWFGLLYWHTDGASSVLLRYYRAGGALSPQVATWLGYAWIAATAGISVAYVVHLWRRWQQGTPPSVLKIALLAVSCSFYLYAFGYAPSKLIAFGLFEGYHDIQYLAIVWIFNHNRVQRDKTAGGFTRYLFRQRGYLIALYVLLCLGFGSYDFFARSLSDEAWTRVALSVITGLALIHFYFDGFIWRIREPETRSSLGVEGSVQTRPRGFARPVRHLALWAALGIPVLILGIFESTGGAVDDVAACRATLRLRENSHKAHYLLSMKLRDTGAREEALVHARRCRALMPGYDVYDMLYADLTLSLPDVLTRRELNEALSCYERAARTQSRNATLFLSWGQALRLANRNADAMTALQRSVRLDPANHATHLELAALYLYQHDAAQAIRHLEAGVRLKPDDVDARTTLGMVWQSLGEYDRAELEYTRVLEIDSQHARAGLGLAATLVRGIAHGANKAEEQLARARRYADAVAATDPADADTCRELSSVYATLRDYSAATQWGLQALRGYEQSGRAALAEQLRGELENYRQPVGN